ncbi:MAG: phospholipase D family protein [Ekhidna sp.]|uniref:phospholipase D family protein n=1 Tax=Ekhidna sp. TaxID=2608089 RepID=UPI0032985061
MEQIINLGTVLKRQVPNADKVYIASALMKEYGFNILESASGTAKVKLLLGIDLPTPPSAFEYLISHESIESRVFQDEKISYHPKVYLLEVDGAWQAFVGSANFTEGGCESNIEMTLATDDPEHTSQLLKWFEKVYDQGIEVDANWLEDYKKHWNSTKDADNQKRKSLKSFKRKFSKASTIDMLAKYNFNGQFFQYDHHNAFSGNKPRERKNPDVIEERMNVKRRLLDLHDLIWPIIQKTNWNLNHHYDSNHIVSSHAHSEGTADELHALWLSFNRPKREFQKLAANSTPLLQMRLQVLVRYTNVAVHLTVGKNGGGYFERMTIREKLRRRDDDFLPEFSSLLANLPEPYYLDINGENRNVHSFDSESDLRDFILKDDQENHYFIIGRMYQPDASEISKTTIARTVIDEFERLMPIYKLLTVPV